MSPDAGPLSDRAGADGVEAISVPNGTRRGGHRGLLVSACAIVAVGVVAVALGVWFNDITADDGTGANIGAGILALFGSVVGAGGMVMLLVVAVIAFVRSSRA